MNFGTLVALSSLALPLASQSALAASGDSWECKGLESGNFYDLAALDVGDEKGEVSVNNGGAPQNFAAEYRETSEGTHRFIFGYELFNDGIVPRLSKITLSKKGSKWTAKASYFEHDYSSQSHQLIVETLACKKLK